MVKSSILYLSLILLYTMWTNVHTTVLKYIKSLYHPYEWAMGYLSRADELAQKRRIELLRVPTPSLEEQCLYYNHCDEKNVSDHSQNKHR